MDKQPHNESNSEAEIEKLISDFIRISKQMQVRRATTPEEQAQMEKKKAVFMIKGLRKRYILEIVGLELRESDNLDDVTTYCYSASPKVFLETIDRILSGDVDAFKRALERGDFVMKGKQSFHDRIMWAKALERLSAIRNLYSQMV